MKQSATWKDLVHEVIEKLPRSFTLSDALAHRELIAQQYADDRFIDEKLRLSLYILRDLGALRVLEKGHYEKTDAASEFSPAFDARVARGAARRKRLMAETWVELNLYCVSCEGAALRRLSPDESLADFECPSCQALYEIRARDGRFGDSVPGSRRAMVLQAIRDGLMPDQILIEFDSHFKSVVFVRIIPGNLIGEERIVPRKRNSTIHVAGLPSVEIVRPSDLDHAAVRTNWRTMAGDSLWAMVRRTVK
jgi:predicted RNA-binding Zn-ribbon protein involved in translation (DUF1610 family)